MLLVMQPAEESEQEKPKVRVMARHYSPCAHAVHHYAWSRFPDAQSETLPLPGWEIDENWRCSLCDRKNQFPDVLQSLLEKQSVVERRPGKPSVVACRYNLFFHVIHQYEQGLHVLNWYGMIRYRALAISVGYRYSPCAPQAQSHESMAVGIQLVMQHDSNPPILEQVVLVMPHVTGSLT